MTLRELKKSIDKTDNDFKVFQCEDNYFLAKQYMQAICESKNLSIKYINSLDEILASTNTFISDFSPVLNVLIIEEFSYFINDVSLLDNCIVICKKIKKEVKESIKDFIVVFPKLLDWQIKDYIKYKCNILTDDEVNWLYMNTDGNIYKIENELDKILLFDKKDQESIFIKIKNEENTDLFYFDKFYLLNAIKANDKISISRFLYLDKCVSISPLFLISCLVNDYKKILFVKFNSGLTKEKLGMSDGQYRFIKNNFSTINETKIKKVLELLTTLEQDIKFGKILLDDRSLCEYIICKIILINDSVE